MTAFLIKKGAIGTWWDANKAAYGNKIKNGIDFLTEKHGVLLAEKFGLRFQYHKSRMIQATDVENGIDKNTAPAITVFSSPNHYSAHLPEQLLLDYYAVVTEDSKQLIVSSTLPEQHQEQIDKLCETAVVAFTSELSDKEFYTKVQRYFNMPHSETTSESSSETLTFTEYFGMGSFKLHTKQVTTTHGIVLQFTQEKSRAKGSARYCGNKL